jgi:hypothetical protein
MLLYLSINKGYYIHFLTNMIMFLMYIITEFIKTLDFWKAIMYTITCCGFIPH